MELPACVSTFAFTIWRRQLDYLPTQSFLTTNKAMETSFLPRSGVQLTRTPFTGSQAHKWAKKHPGTLTCLSKNVEGENKDKIPRRSVLDALVLSSLTFSFGGGNAIALDSRRANRTKKIPESEYTTLPSGLKIYDVTVGSGTEAVLGSRVAIHYIAKWKGITFQTSRQGAGVTGGTPYGFDVGSSELGYVLKGLDLGVQGMRVGGERLLIVPPELAYGDSGVQEIPPGATLEFNVELLSIKKDAFGTPVKLVEG